MTTRLNIACPEAVAALLSRRSVKTRDMTGPGPDAAALDTILAAGRRVPDHGKLAPWRFLVFTGEARAALGEAIAAAYLAEESAPSPAVARQLAGLPLEAPVLVVLVSAPSDARPIPLWEQQLSAGSAGMAMLTAAHMLGHVGQWITGWPAYSKSVHRVLGLAEKDRIAGLLFFGDADRTPSERPRPEADEVVRHFRTREDVAGG